MIGLDLKATSKLAAIWMTNPKVLLLSLLLELICLVLVSCTSNRTVSSAINDKYDEW